MSSKKETLSSKSLRRKLERELKFLYLCHFRGQLSYVMINVYEHLQFTLSE